MFFYDYELFFVDDALIPVCQESNQISCSTVASVHTEHGDCFAMSILHRAFASEKQEEPIKGSIKKLISTYRNTHVHRQTRAFTHKKALVSSKHTNKCIHTHAFNHARTCIQFHGTHTFTHRQKTNTHTVISEDSRYTDACHQKGRDGCSTKCFDHSGAFTSRCTARGNASVRRKAAQANTARRMCICV